MKPLSLKLRAISLLSQREHSLTELRRKLKRIVIQREAASDGELDAAAASTEVEDLLLWLQEQGYLSESRFIESRINARSPRYGSLRIKQELAQHGLALSAENQQLLKDSELERARAIWQRKFAGQQAEDLAARAKQTRFMLARGFPFDVIQRLLRAQSD
jgi:regulatory protein